MQDTPSPGALGARGPRATPRAAWAWRHARGPAVAIAARLAWVQH